MSKTCPYTQFFILNQILGIWPYLRGLWDIFRKKTYVSRMYRKLEIHELQMGISWEIIGVRRQIRPFFDTTETELFIFPCPKVIWGSCQNSICPLGNPLCNVTIIWNDLLPLIRQLFSSFSVKFWRFWCEQVFNKLFNLVFIRECFPISVLQWLKK